MKLPSKEKLNSKLYFKILESMKYYFRKKVKMPKQTTPINKLKMRSRRSEVLSID